MTTDATTKTDTTEAAGPPGAPTTKETGARVRAALVAALDEDPRLKEPLNALVVWTELGKGLCGTLDRKGADVGLLGRIVERWCAEKQAAEVDLSTWAYRVEGSARLSPDELAGSLRRIEQALAPVIEPLAAGEEQDGGRAAFLAVVDGWFPVGLELLRRFPRGPAATPAERLGALRAWCDRYLPHDPAGPKELGVRVVRED